MKKLYFSFVGIAVVALAVIISCTKDYGNAVSESGETEGAKITVAEARAFFETQMEKTAISRATKKESKKGIFSVDFTPRWNDATTASNEHFSSVDVLIQASHKFKSYRTESVDGKPKAYAVNVEQKLTIVKNQSSGRMIQLLMTFIPEQEYAKTHKNDVSGDFRFASENNGFSGFIIYTSPATQKLVGVGKIVNGEMIKRVMLGKDKEKNVLKLKTIHSLLKQFHLERRANSTLSRSYDYEEDEGCPECGDEYCLGFCDDEGCPECGDEYCLGFCDDDDDDDECPDCGGRYCGAVCVNDDKCPWCNSLGCYLDCWERRADCDFCGDVGCHNCRSYNCDYCEDIWPYCSSCIGSGGANSGDDPG